MLRRCTIPLSITLCPTVCPSGLFCVPEKYFWAADRDSAVNQRPHTLTFKHTPTFPHPQEVLSHQFIESSNVWIVVGIVSVDLVSK